MLNFLIITDIYINATSSTAELLLC